MLVASLDVEDEAGASIVAATNETTPGRAFYHRCDVSSRDEVRSVFARAVKDLGGLDALVHMAGGEATAPVESMTEEQWDHLLDVNLKETFLNQSGCVPSSPARWAAE